MEENSGLDFKRMIREIDELVETEFCFDMDCHNLPNSKPFTQEESLEMANIIGRIYLIAHCITCTACCGKYKKE